MLRSCLGRSWRRRWRSLRDYAAVVLCNDVACCCDFTNQGELASRQEYRLLLWIFEILEQPGILNFQRATGRGTVENVRCRLRKRRLAVHVDHLEPRPHHDLVGSVADGLEVQSWIEMPVLVNEQLQLEMELDVVGVQGKQELVLHFKPLVLPLRLGELGVPLGQRLRYLHPLLEVLHHQLAHSSTLGHIHRM